MVKAMVDIEPRTNQVLNIVKAKYSLKDKSEAIDKVVEIYEVEVLEPELKPAYVKKIKQARKEKSIKVESFADRYGLN